MFYKTRRGCKVVPIEPFVIMSGHNNSNGLSRYDTDALLFNRHGIEINSTGRRSERQITPCSDLIVVHNFTSQELVKVDPTGIRTSIPVESMYNLRYNHLFSNNGGLLDDTKLKLEQQCTSVKKALVDHAAIIKLTSVIGCNIEQLRLRIHSFGFPQAIKDSILETTPQGMRVGNVFSYVYEFMLVYLVSSKEFETNHTIIEPQTQVCLTKLKLDDAYGHPLDIRQDSIDVSCLEDPTSKNQPIYFNAEMVYHHHPFDSRYINTNGKVSLLPQFKDTTREEGFYLTHFRIMENGVGMAYKTNFTPPKGLTEENGFYKSAEFASKRCTTEQAQRTLEELADLHSCMKTFKSEFLKELSSYTKTSIEKMMQLTERSLIETRNYVEKKQEQNLESLDAALKTIDKLQTELKDTKRIHESSMQTKKEIIETLKIVPPILGCIAGVIAMRKKNKQ
jgi:hypothetical protein